MKRARKTTRPRPSAPLGMAAIALLLVLAGAYLRATLPPVRVPTPDEIGYTIYGAAVARDGPSGVAGLVRAYNSDPSMTENPSPTRAGYVLLVSGMMNATGSITSFAASRLSMLASIAALALAAWTGWRFLGPGAAVVALCFMAASPPDLAIARRVWQDGLLGLLALGMLYALLAHRARDAVAGSPSGPQPRTAWAVVVLALGGYSLLVKETGLLLLALGTLGLAWTAWREAGPRRAAVTLIAGAAAFAIAVGLLAILCGGLAPLRDTFTRAMAAESTSPYMLKYQTGSPFYYVTGFGMLQPLPFALGFAAALLVVLRVPLRAGAWSTPVTRNALGVTAWLVLAFAAVAALYPQKNLRFLAPIYAPVYLLAGALAHAGLVSLRPRVSRAVFAALAVVLAVALVALALADMRRFHEFFIRLGIPDLATPWFVERAGS